MDLHSAFERGQTEYPAAQEVKFASHPLAGFLRHDLPQYLQSLVDPRGTYLAVGSAGQSQSQWAKGHRMIHRFSEPPGTWQRSALPWDLSHGTLLRQLRSGFVTLRQWSAR